MAGGKPSQRERLLAAMTVVAARYGYGGASVARVVSQAGVSRATFYEHFADKQSCFLAAYRDVVTRIGQKLATPRTAGKLPARILADLLAAAETQPAEARLVLIEALAADGEVRTEHERFLAGAEEMIERGLEHGSGGQMPLELPARALLGGVTGTVAIRVFRGEAGHLGGLRDDLVAWAGSYATTPGAARLRGEDWLALGARMPRVAPAPWPAGEEPLPRGRGALPAAVVAEQQRERILAAIARLSRQKGYAAMTVSDVVATAEVTRKAFYDQFRSKEDAFLAAQAFGLEASVALTASRFFSDESWPERVWHGAWALGRYVAGQPDLVFVDLVESYAAGPAAIRRSYESRMAYTLFLADGYRQRPEAERLPRLSSEAVSGAIHELMRQQVLCGRTDRMLEILPQVAFVTLAPFLGAPAALEFVRAKVDEEAAASAVADQ